MRREFYLQLYKAILQKDASTKNSITKRKAGIGDNTCRDASQSNLGRSLPVSFQVELLKRIIRSGIPFETEESNGGAYPQFDMLENRVGDCPTYLLERAKRCMFAQREILEEIIAKAGGDIESEVFTELFARFVVATGDENREFLSRQKVQEILVNSGVKELQPGMPLGKEAVRIYFLKQTILFRGKFCVALNEIPEFGIRLLVKRLHQCGCDVFRVFDGLNYLPNMEPAIKAALDCGAMVQPVLHADPNFALGVEGYISNMRKLIELCGNSMEAIVVKDAPGLVTPDFAYKLSRALSEELERLAVCTTLVLHTHDNSGSALLSYLEFIRGASKKQAVRVECGFGKGVMSSPNGQPDFCDFLDITMGTAFGANFEFEVGEVKAKAEELDAFAKTAVTDDVKLPIKLTTLNRFLTIKAGLPGGMTGTYLLSLYEQVLGFGKKYEDRPSMLKANFGIDALKENGELTKDGEDFLRAYFNRCLKDMIIVNQELGFVSRVTPVSQWVGTQAVNLVNYGLGKKFYNYTKVNGQMTLVENENYNRVEAYTMMTGAVKNHLIVLATTPELQKMYPKADRSLILRSFSSLKDCQEAMQIDFKRVRKSIPLDVEQAIDTDELLNAIGLLEEIRKLGNRPSIDVEVFGVVKAIMQLPEGNNGVGERASTISGLAQGQMTREMLIKLTGNDLFKDESELRETHQKEGQSEDDFMLRVCFTQGGLGNSFIERRETMKEAYLKARNALKDMGVDTESLC